MPKVKKKLKDEKYSPLNPFQLADCRAFGITLIRFPYEDGEFAYRALLELEVETSKQHSLSLLLDVYDIDPHDAALEAVICGSRLAPGHFEQISIFDEDGNYIEDLPITVAELLDEIEFSEYDLNDEELDTKRVLH